MMDQCSKYCGKPFQAQIGKFRFLNELIKLVSPKVVLAYGLPLYVFVLIEFTFIRYYRGKGTIENTVFKVISMSLLCILSLRA